MNDEVWYGARCVFRFDGMSDDDPTPAFEERVTLHRAESFEEAAEAAIRAAQAYEAEPGPVFVGTVDVYRLAEEPGDGAEVFSLLRQNEASASEYVCRFVRTGSEVESYRTELHGAVEPAAVGRRRA